MLRYSLQPEVLWLLPVTCFLATRNRSHKPKRIQGHNPAQSKKVQLLSCLLLTRKVRGYELQGQQLLLNTGETVNIVPIFLLRS